MGHAPIYQPICVSLQKDRISKAHEVATAATNKAARKQKDNYDHKVRGGTVQIGDRVLVKVVSFEGKHKLADRWEHDPYVVEPFTMSISH
jgi:hypothetical protein